MVSMICVRVKISGEVQGVGFRYHTVEAASRFGVTGWVRNVFDGTVEALAEGEHDAVEAFVAWCREGPRMARVDDVVVKIEAYGNTFEGFGVWR